MGAPICPRCAEELPRQARFCAFCGVALDHTALPSARDERRVITALFADLAGSTQLGERLDPEDFRDLTGGALAVMGAAIEDMGGTVRGTAGDGVLGLFGAPTAHEDDAERAVIAGLRLVRGMRAYSEEAARRWDVENLRVRVGIETGLAVLGEVRAGSQVQYDASGDCLNTAARLEGAADADGVLVGPLTRRHVAEAFVWGDPRPLVLKGKAGPVVACHALTSRGAGRAEGSAPTPSPPLVGRDRELLRTAQVVAEVGAGNPRTVVVTGEAGIGKTRFIAEVRRQLESVGDGAATPTWLEGTCLSYALDDPYLPFRQILRQALGSRADTVPGLREASAALVGPSRAAEIGSLLGLVLGLQPEGEDLARFASLSAESLQQKVIAAVAQLVVGLAERAPVALAVDDLHWADASSLRLVEGLVETLPDGVPALLILAMRPESDRSAWVLREQLARRHPQRVSELALAALAHDEVRWLISGLVGDDTLPHELERTLLGRAEGNPFYLRELLRSLHDSGAIVEADGRWTFDHGVPVDVPESVERVVLARLDRLPPRDRDLLNCAAVIGREFDLPLLGRVADASLSPASLSTLIRLGLFERTRSRDFRFGHPLIQETAYKSMLRRGRAALHGRAAVAIEEVAGTGSVAHHSVLARHHSAAGDFARAVKHHRLAAISAQRAVAMDEAASQLDLAIAAARSLEPASARVHLPELLLLRGHVRGRCGDFTGGSEDVRHALEGARANKDQQVEMQALNELGWLIRVHGYEESLALHQQALDIADSRSDSAAQVTALSRMSMIHLNRLRLAEGLQLAQRAVGIARDDGRDPLLGTALDCLKLAALQLGHLELLERTVAEIIDVQERVGDYFLLQWAYIEGATAPLARGDLDQARARIDLATQVNQRFVSDRLARALILEARSWIERAAGDTPAAVAIVREAIDLLGDQTAPEWSAWLEGSLGSHLIEQGRPVEAITALEPALRHAEAIKSPNRAFRAAGHLAWARVLVGDDGGAQAALGQATEVLATVTAPAGSVFLEGHGSYVAIARACVGLGKADDARDLLVPVLAAARATGWLTAEREVRAVLDPLLGPPQVNRAGAPDPPGPAPSAVDDP